MHGLGADGHDFAGIEREVTPPGAAVRYVYPHAPMMPVTINNGYVMRAWSDVFRVSAERLAGVMALSCFLPVARSVATEASAANRDVPLFMAHGIADDLIPVARARAARDTLLGLGYEVEWHEYPMAHSLCPQEIEDIAAWLQRTLER